MIGTPSCIRPIEGRGYPPWATTFVLFSLAFNIQEIFKVEEKPFTPSVQKLAGGGGGGVTLPPSPPPYFLAVL
jgi:hypothetical protein